MIQNPFQSQFNQSLADAYRLQQYNQYNQVNVVQHDRFREVRNKIDNLSVEEKELLSQDKSFMDANNNYESELLLYICDRFRDEFNNSNKGIELINNLSKHTDNALDVIKDNMANERQQMREFQELLKQNPELLKQLKDGKTD